MPQFGWLPPTDEKRAQNERYLLQNVLAAPESVERILKYPTNLVGWYTQRNNGCTGFSASWMASVYNSPKKYNANWLYWEGRREAGLNPNQDGGGYIWAVMDVLRKRGHCLDNTTSPVKAEGIQSYYWAKNPNDARAAVDAGRPPVFGVNWYEEFLDPVIIDGERWIGTHPSWGRIAGGHAICCIGASDKRSAFLLLNSWGAEYPPVWISYSSISKLLSQQGECAVALDIDPTPEPPDPTPTDEIATIIKLNGVKYTGKLKKVS